MDASPIVSKALCVMMKKLLRLAPSLINAIRGQIGLEWKKLIHGDVRLG